MAVGGEPLNVPPPPPPGNPRIIVGERAPAPGRQDPKGLDQLFSTA